MDVRRITILGVGLLGGSIGLALRYRIKGCAVVGYGHKADTLSTALQMGAITCATQDPGDAVQDSDLVILCTPVSTIGPLLKQIAPKLAASTVVTDVGSTKQSIVEAGESALSRPGQFVGSHPMAGSEKRGVQFARADLFDNALCLITPTPKTEPGAIEFVERFWRTLGMRISRLSPAAHDHRLAEVSHLPHALAAALVSMADPSSLEAAGKGFLDLTRIAGGDGGLWRDILLDNRANVLGSIDHLKATLAELEAMLMRQDKVALKEWLDRAAAKRERMIDGRA